MDINLAGIRNQLIEAYQYSAEKLGILATHSVRLLKIGRNYVQHDARLAGATFVVANILFLETAVRLSSVANKLFLYLFGKESEWSKKGLLVKNVAVLAFVTSTVIGLNVALAKGIRSTLSPMTIVGISIASCASYIFLRLWLASKKSSETK